MRAAHVDLWTRTALLQLSDEAFDALVDGLRAERELRAERAEQVQRAASARAQAIVAKSQAGSRTPPKDREPFGTPQRNL